MSRKMVACLVTLIATLLVAGSVETPAEQLEPDCAIWRALPKPIRDQTPPPPNCVDEDYDPFPTSDPE